MKIHICIFFVVKDYTLHYLYVIKFPGWVHSSPATWPRSLDERHRTHEFRREDDSRDWRHQRWRRRRRGRRWGTYVTLPFIIALLWWMIETSQDSQFVHTLAVWRLVSATLPFHFRMIWSGAIIITCPTSATAGAAAEGSGTADLATTKPCGGEVSRSVRRRETGENQCSGAVYCWKRQTLLWLGSPNQQKNGGNLLQGINKSWPHDMSYQRV